MPCLNDTIAKKVCNCDGYLDSLFKNYTHWRIDVLTHDQYGDVKNYEIQFVFENKKTDKYDHIKEFKFTSSRYSDNFKCYNKDNKSKFKQNSLVENI